MSAHAARNYYEISRSCPRSVGLWRAFRTGCDLHRSSLDGDGDAIGPELLMGKYERGRDIVGHNSPFDRKVVRASSSLAIYPSYHR